jgi:Brp/Blh family beta-carotene 15,15'-monooxygenase
LFEKQTVLTIFSFLDEKSSLYQEVKIFASLPILSFLKALLLYLKIEKWTRYVYAFVIVTTYLILSSWNNQIASHFGYILLVVGLLLIGIPHGALDHILSKNKETHLVNFIAKYVFIILLYFIIWQQYPVIALSIFILYSSFHFGESELIDTNKQIDTFNNYLHAFLLGLSILLFIIFSHLNESLSIISGLVSVAKLDSLNFTFITPTAIILSISYLLIQSILSKKGSYIGLIFLLLLGVKIPLMLAFGLYFIFQHSFNAWQHLKSGLQMSSLQLLKKSSLYTIAALLMLLFIIIFDYKKIININSLWINFFIFIACISFPHFVLMHIFYKKNL